MPKTGRGEYQYRVRTYTRFLLSVIESEYAQEAFRLLSWSPQGSKLEIAVIRDRWMIDS